MIETKSQQEIVKDVFVKFLDKQKQIKITGSVEQLCTTQLIY